MLLLIYYVDGDNYDDDNAAAADEINKKALHNTTQIRQEKAKDQFCWENVEKDTEDTANNTDTEDNKTNDDLYSQTI